jgi:hypothetical protein
LTAIKPSLRLHHGTLTIELPPREDQTQFNLHRWDELLGDPELAKIQGRIETDRHGQIILNRIAAPLHGRFQSKIGHLLESIFAGRRSDYRVSNLHR